MVDAGDGACDPGMADVSVDVGSVFPLAFCNSSKRSGKSGCVLCGSTLRGDRVDGGCVDEGNAARTIRKSLLKSATD